MIRSLPHTFLFPRSSKLSTQVFFWRRAARAGVGSGKGRRGPVGGGRRERGASVGTSYDVSVFTICCRSVNSSEGRAWAGASARTPPHRPSAPNPRPPLHPHLHFPNPAFSMIARSGRDWSRPADLRTSPWWKGSVTFQQHTHAHTHTRSTTDVHGIFRLNDCSF